jgi:hypothetical protein
MYEGALANVQNITSSNLNGVIVLLKELDRAEQAAEVLRHFIINRGQDRKLFDLSQDPFKADITDPDVVLAFDERLASFPDDRTVATVLDQIAENKSWTEGDLTFLSRAAVDDYYKLFRESEGKELSKRIDMCLQFDRVANASSVMKEVSQHARKALTRLSIESPINARRVRKYGILNDDTEPT